MDDTSLEHRLTTLEANQRNMKGNLRDLEQELDTTVASVRDAIVTGRVIRLLLLSGALLGGAVLNALHYLVRKHPELLDIIL